MPMTSLTCTSRQARTHRLHWMQASRLTAIAVWLRSGAAGWARSGDRVFGGPPAPAHCHQNDWGAVGKSVWGEPLAVDALPQMRLRIGRDVALGLVGEQELRHHPPRVLRAIG